MDEKLSQALERSNFMTTLANQKRLLWEKYQDDLVYYKDGHEIHITESLITFCTALLQSNRTRSVFTDENKIPFVVDDIEGFLTNLLDQYSSASNLYYTEYENLKKNRSVEGLVNL